MNPDRLALKRHITIHHRTRVPNGRSFEEMVAQHSAEHVLFGGDHERFKTPHPESYCAGICFQCGHHHDVIMKPEGSTVWHCLYCSMPDLEPDPQRIATLVS